MHFYINNIPIDLNIKTLGEIEKLKFVKGFETALLDASSKNASKKTSMEALLKNPENKKLLKHKK